MVLDDSTTTPIDFTSDYTPDSDTDPYSTNPPADKYIQVIVPRPLPIIGPLFGYNKSHYTTVIHSRIQASAQILGRPPTQDEATALAHWSAKMLSYAVWGRPLGLAAGWYQAYRTAATYRFPFMQPNLQKFNPYFIGLSTFQLHGRGAQLMWHLLRTCAYGTFGMWTGGLFVGTYAATVAAVGERQDPRLQDLIRAIQAKVREKLPDGATEGAPGRQRRGAQRGDPTGQGSRSASELWKNHRTAIGADDAPLARSAGTYGDDASPSSGDAYDAYDSSPVGEQGRSLAMSEGSVLTDRQMRRQEARQRPNRRSSPTENTASTFRTDKVERQPRSFDDNDASPTGGEGSFMGSDYGSDSSSATTGSTWERIRQQSSSSSVSASAGRGGRGNRRGMQTQEDGFASSGTEEETNMAKEEAQRAFDERVERERRGGQF